METALRTDALKKMFGGLAAVNGVSLECRVGSVHAVIGPNGAGKTSLFNCITGFYKPQSGSITLGGTETLASAPAERQVKKELPGCAPGSSGRSRSNLSCSPAYRSSRRR